MMNAAAAVILARGGSKGISRKNLRLVCHTPLVALAVQAAKAAALVEWIYVSTDDKEIAAVAESAGAEVIWRPKELATDDADSNKAYRHALEFVDVRCDVIVAIEATTLPHVPMDLDRAIRAIDDDHADSVIVVKRTATSLWRRGRDGYGMRINQYDAAPRQTADVEYEVTGACWAVRRAELLRTGRIVCGRVALVERVMPFVDIDEPIDLAMAETLVKELTR